MFAPDSTCIVESGHGMLHGEENTKISSVSYVFLCLGRPNIGGEANMITKSI
jgi:hypothetical protein